MKFIRWSHPWLIKLIPMTGLAIAVLDWVVLQCANHGKLDSPPFGWMVTGKWTINLIWQSGSALFYSYSGFHWLFNMIFLCIASWILSASYLGWLNQWLIFFIGGYLANLGFAIILTSFQLHYVIMGSSPGIMAMLSANIINIGYWQYQSHHRHDFPKLSHWKIKLIITLVSIWIILAASPFRLFQSSGLHILGLLGGIIVIFVMQKCKFKRA